jgi:hypothetical protein
VVEQPHAVWVGLLHRLQKVVARHLRQRGFEQDRRGFRVPRRSSSFL